MKRPDLANWQVEFLRATAFTTDVISPTYGDEHWKKVVGVEAEEISRKAALGTFSASATIEGTTVALSITPGRIDWLLTPATIEAALEQSLGRFAEQDERFIDRLSSWLQFPTLVITRIALGEVLRLPVDSRVEGYKTLATYLPKIAPDPEQTRDFLYQINRPRESKVIPGLVINRLSKWASVELNIGAIGSAKPAASLRFVRLELDLSTDQYSERDLSKDKALSPLFHELLSLGREIATGGDIP